MAFREILVLVIGTTPQIVTETLYGLYFERSILPDEIHVVTTGRGMEMVRDELFEKGRWAGFFDEFDLRRIPEERVNILVAADDRGGRLEDIRDTAQNEAVGELIVGLIRDKASEPDTRLHCSLAGGRKTMSFYLGAALQLFGRPWDKLYHVLVTPEFESHPDFYYKPRKDTFLERSGPGPGKEGRLNTRDAVITLAELPFIRLREKLTLGAEPFRELVAKSQRELDAALVQDPLMVELQERTVTVGARTIEMAPMQLMVYCAFLREKVYRCRYPERVLCHDCTACFPALVDLATRQALEEMAEDYRRIYGRRSGRAEELLHQRREGFDVEALRQLVSKINRTLREGLGDETLFPIYAVTAVGKHGAKRHGVRVERGKVSIRE